MARWLDHHSKALMDYLPCTGMAVGWVMDELPSKLFFLITFLSLRHGYPWRWEVPGSRGGGREIKLWESGEVFCCVDGRI